MAALLGTVSARPVAAPRLGIYPIIIMLFGAWVVAATAGLGGLLRPVFPLVTAAIGASLLHTGRKADYVTFVVWVFMLTPGLRRYVDLGAGWSQVNLLMLAPYTASILTVWPVMQSLWRRSFAYSGLVAVVLSCIAYGLVIATIDDRIFSAAFDVLRWASPLCFGLFIAVDHEGQQDYRNAIARTMVVALIALSAYGVYQFIIAPPWDTMWMKESKLLSIGYPEPFKIRVFGTMNSPASLASFLMAGLLWVIPSTAMLRPLSIGAGLVGLLLTLVRTSWLGLVVGVIFLVVFGASARARLSIVVGMLCLPLVVLAVGQIPTGAEIINTRIASMSEVSNDVSFLERSSDYAEFFNVVLPQAPFGTGLGSNGNYQSYMDQRAAKIVDGAVMEIGMALGVFAGGAYLLAVLAMAGIACWNSIRSQDTFLSSCGAIVAALSLSLVAGNVAVGEVGMLFWTAIGFCLAARSPAVAASRA